MFCPNCGTTITLAQKFCRGCGLRLEKIAEELALQLPTQAHADLLRRVLLYEKIGLAALIIFGLIIVVGVLYMIIFGVNFKPITTLSTILIIVMILCGLLSCFFFNYANHLREKVTSPGFRQSETELAVKTVRQLEEKPFEPANVPASVTENTTELLYAEKSKKTNDLN